MCESSSEHSKGGSGDSGEFDQVEAGNLRPAGFCLLSLSPIGCHTLPDLQPAGRSFLKIQGSQAWPQEIRGRVAGKGERRGESESSRTVWRRSAKCTRGVISISCKLAGRSQAQACISPGNNGCSDQSSFSESPFVLRLMGQQYQIVVIPSNFCTRDPSSVTGFRPKLA